MNKMGKALVISSVKGGVGKTITTINLAGICELIGKKVLIIDFDIYTGNVALALNCKFISNMYNLTQDISTNRYKSIKDYVVTYDEYIDILPAPKDPRASLKIDLTYIETIIDIARSSYDVVLIDSTHILNELNIRLIDKADKLLLLMENDPMDVKNMKALLNIIKNSERINFEILLNDSRDPLKKYFSSYDLKAIINNDFKYKLTSNFYLKNIDEFIMNGGIITLNQKMATVFNKEFVTFTNIINDLLLEGNKDNG